jgi:hypothetical protein
MDQKNWHELMKLSPFAKPHFTGNLKTQIIKKANQNSRKEQVYGTIPTFIVILLSVAVMSTIMLSIYLERAEPGKVIQTDERDGKWTVRYDYVRDGVRLFTINPDPQLSAGKIFGYMINFTAPFEQFEGKILTIRAIHKETGMVVTATPHIMIKERTSGYSSLDRFTTSFALPLSGLWVYEVELDGIMYGDAVLSVAEPSWDVSPLFTSGTYQLRGIPNRVGFIDAGFIAGRSNKYLWHFWGTEAELNGNFKVKALKKGTHQFIDLFSADYLGGKNNGADRSIPTSMSLPTSGRWKLLAYMNDQLFGSIVIDVK